MRKEVKLFDLDEGGALVRISSFQHDEISNTWRSPGEIVKYWTNNVQRVNKLQLLAASSRPTLSHAGLLRLFTVKGAQIRAMVNCIDPETPDHIIVRKIAEIISK